LIPALRFRIINGRYQFRFLKGTQVSAMGVSFKTETFLLRLRERPFDRLMALSNIEGHHKTDIKENKVEEKYRETLFGVLVVKNGFITDDQLGEALDLQRKQDLNGEHRFIGSILYGLGYMTIQQIDEVIELQKKYRLVAERVDTSD